jgi:hypothetical protein
VSQSQLQKISFDPVTETVVGEPEQASPGYANHSDVSPDGEWLAFDTIFDVRFPLQIAAFEFFLS